MKAEVRIGDYLADVELMGGAIYISITGAEINKRLFEDFLRKEHTIKMVSITDAAGEK